MCASLGELSEINHHSWVRHNPDHPDVTTNVRLQINVSEADRTLWELMDEATYAVLVNSFLLDFNPFVGMIRLVSWLDFKPTV